MYIFSGERSSWLHISCMDNEHVLYYTFHLQEFWTKSFCFDKSVASEHFHKYNTWSVTLFFCRFIVITNLSNDYLSLLLLLGSFNCENFFIVRNLCVSVLLKVIEGVHIAQGIVEILFNIV